jgi:hypothetical protein
MKELKKVSKLAHMEQVAHLKEKFEMGHGHANANANAFTNTNANAFTNANANANAFTNNYNGNLERPT